VNLVEFIPSGANEGAMTVHVKIGHKMCSKNNNCTFLGFSVYENLGIHTKIVYL